MTAARKLSPAKKSTPSINPDTETTVSGGYDPFKQSTLFHEVYLNVEVPHKFKDLWEPRDPKEFENFCNSFRNLCSEYDFRDFDSWSEMDTIQNWIIPVLEMLGYYDKCEGTAKPFSLDTSFTFEKKTLRPDFIIVDRPSDLKRIKDSDNSPEQKLSEAREYVKLTIEAKYWDRLNEYYNLNLTEDKKRADNKKPSTNETKDPVEQTLEYMKMLHNDWGILTDGKVWRLYHRELSSDSQKRCLQFNLGYLAKFAEYSLSSDSEEQKLFNENAKYFFYLFNKNALFGREGKGKLLDHLIEYSKEYVHKIEDDLRVRFVQAMTTFCNGLHESMGKPKGEDKLDLIRNVAESHLFNIMFIKSCESRLILPMKGDYLGKSLTRMVQCLKRYKPERQFDDHNLEMLQSAFGNQTDDNAFKFAWDGTELYERLMDLTEFIQKGSNSKFKNFKIEGFTESVFSDVEWNLAKKNKVSNRHMVAALFEIGYAKPDPKINKYQQIPYNFFTARQLGSIYESFLDFKIKFAATNLAYVDHQWVEANPQNERILKSGVPTAKKTELYFTPDNSERKATGSYYTPDYIVQKIVEDSISNFVQGKRYSEIANIKVCDPAMGSGHFVGFVLNYLAREYLAAFERENYSDNPISIQDAKCEVLHSCIYGVDLNPRAAKLTKMSLWLESAKAGQKLENLEDQIKVGDSVNSESFDWQNAFPEIFSKRGGFDVVVMNPPYLGIKDNSHKIGYLRNLTEWQSLVTNKYDLLYFFLARATQICRPQGVIGAITTSYWPTADGASKLREFLANDVSVVSLSFFNELKLFADAKGQHNLISIFRKSRSEMPIEITSYKALVKGYTLRSLNESYLAAAIKNREIEIKTFNSSFNNADLIGIGTNSWNFSVKKNGEDHLILEKLKSHKTFLNEYFDIHSGIETGADRVTNKHLSPKSGDKLDRNIKQYRDEIKANNILNGDGIFVIKKDELAQLKLSKEESEKYIRPLIKNGIIRKNLNFCYKTCSHFLIYFQNGKLDSKSKIYRHLEKFRPILENRYKFRTEDRLKWFDLHRPLDVELIAAKKIISPYRAVKPFFSFADQKTFALLDVFFTTPLKKTSNLFLALGVLNSSAAWYWLRKEGKTKGNIVELTAKPISGVPFRNYHFEDADLKSVKQQDIFSGAKLKKMKQEEAARLISALIMNSIKNDIELSEIQSVLNSLSALYFGLDKSELEFIDAYLAEFQNAAPTEDSDDEVAA